MEKQVYLTSGGNCQNIVPGETNICWLETCTAWSNIVDVGLILYHYWETYLVLCFLIPHYQKEMLSNRLRNNSLPYSTNNILHFLRSPSRIAHDQVEYQWFNNSLYTLSRKKHCQDHPSETVQNVHVTLGFCSTYLAAIVGFIYREWVGISTDFMNWVYNKLIFCTVFEYFNKAKHLNV